MAIDVAAYQWSVAMGPIHALIVDDTVTFSLLLIALTVIASAIMIGIAARSPTAADCCREYEFEL